MAYVVMANIVMASVVMAYRVMAYIVKANIVMAYHWMVKSLPCISLYVDFLVVLNIWSISDVGPADGAPEIPRAFFYYYF